MQVNQSAISKTHRTAVARKILSFTRPITFDTEGFSGSVEAASHNARVLTYQELKGISTPKITRPFGAPPVELADGIIQAISAV